VQVDQCAAILLGNNFSGKLQAFEGSRSRWLRTHRQQAVRVHADQDRLRGIIDVTANQMPCGTRRRRLRFRSDQAEFSVPGFYHRLAHAVDVAFMLHAVADSTPRTVSIFIWCVRQKSMSQARGPWFLPVRLFFI